MNISSNLLSNQNLHKKKQVAIYISVDEEEEEDILPLLETICINTKVFHHPIQGITIASKGIVEIKRNY